MKSKKPQPKPPAALALPKISAADAMMHPALFGPWFASASFAAQRTLVRAIFALSPEAGDQERFAALSQRQAWPTLAATEAWILAGRRSGKSLVSAFLAVYLAVFRGYDAILALGEEGTTGRPSPGSSIRTPGTRPSGGAMSRRSASRTSRETR